MADGLHLYENPTGVLTNNPPFPMQLFALNNYAQLSPRPPVNRFSKDLSLREYSRGMGAIGLPGDLSSQSRLPPCGVHEAQRQTGDTEEASCQPVFPHPDLRRADARLLRAWRTENTRSRCTRAAATQKPASITTRPMKTGASRRSGCAQRIWTHRRFSSSRWCSSRASAISTAKPHSLSMLRLFFGTVGAFFRMGKKGLTGAGKADMIDSTLIGNEPALPVHGGIPYERIHSQVF